MDFDINKLASMPLDERMKAVVGGIRQATAVHAAFVAGLMCIGENPKAIAEAGAHLRLKLLPADMIEKLGAEVALKRAAGLFVDQMWEALSRTTEYALFIFRAAQDLAGDTPTPPPAAHAPDPREFADRLRYYADTIERAGGYWEAAGNIADDLDRDQEFEGLEGSLPSHFDAQIKADSTGIALLQVCVEKTLVDRA